MCSSNHPQWENSLRLQEAKLLWKRTWFLPKFITIFSWKFSENFLIWPRFLSSRQTARKQVSEQKQGPSSTSTWFVNSSHPQSTGRRASPQKAWVPTVLGHNPLPLRSESSPETTQMLQQFILQWLAQNDTVPLLSWSLLTCPEWVSSLTENYEEKSHTVPL